MSTASPFSSYSVVSSLRMDKMSTSNTIVKNVQDLLERKLFVLAQEQATIGLEKTPNDVDLLMTLAKVYYDGQDYLAAAETVERALQVYPSNPDILRLAAMSWSQAGIVERGLDLANQFLVASNNSPQAYQLLCNIHEKNGKVSDAREAMSRIPAVDAHKELISLYLSRILYAEKDYDGSIDAVKKYHEWAEVAKGSSIPPDEDLVIDSWFHLSKIYNKIGEYDDAWAAASRAHEIAGKKWNQEAYDKDMENIRKFFTKENVHALAHATDPFEQPVFIVGNARSGSSLLEQILSMHQDVGNGGEMMVTLGIQRRLQSALDSFQEFPNCLFDMRVEDANACSQEYRKATQWFSVGKKRVTNKSIGLQAQIGFLSLILPQSRAIMLHRHPLDNCLSCFTTNLVHTGHDYTESIESLGKTWITRRIMQDYWKEVVEIPVMDLHYDKLVVDQENETRRLLKFLDLDWDDACLQFHTSTRVAATISYDQVNQKMYSSSSGRWKNYEKHLGPLIDIVGDYI